MSQGKRIVLASRPVGEPKPSDFRLEECPVPTPGAGESSCAPSGCRSIPICAGA
jgi:NADPH-dependent curcumin reductase CurA